MRARPPARNGSVAAALLAGVCALATGKVAEAQATCQGSLATSSPSAPALVKYIPAANRSGVVFHAWLDTNRTPSAGHLVIENTNPYPVAVRFDAELWGAAGTVAGGSRCVWLRPREFAVAVHQYPAGTLSAVRIGGAEVSRIEAPPVLASGLVPPRAPRPRTRAVEPTPSRLDSSAPSRPERSSAAPSESTLARQRDASASTRRETSRPTPERVRDIAASTPRRERISSTQVARRDTATRSTAPRREPRATTARRETVARAPGARRDTATRSTASRGETRAPTARRETSAEAPAARRNTVARATPPHRETRPPTWTTLGDTPIASASRAVPPTRATRRDTAARAPAPRLAAVAPAATSRRETAAPDTSSRVASAPDPLARRPDDAADSAGAVAATARVVDEPGDSMLSGAAVIAPRPAPSRSPEGETAESYPMSGGVSGTAGGADTARSVKLREDAPTLAKTGKTVFSVAFAALMVPAGIVLLMAIGGVVWLLAASALRRAWPGRRRD